MRTDPAPVAVRCLWLLLVACLVTRAPAAEACVGDLNGDSRVTVGEIVRCVGSLLGTVPAPECQQAYPGLSIEALIRGVNNALSGCPATDTPTQTMTFTPSLTPTREPFPTPTASRASTAVPTPSLTPGTPTPTTTWTPTRTRTSCVSEAPDVGPGTADTEDAFLWHFGGRSRILLNARGSVVASLNCGTEFAARSPRPQEFDFEVELDHPGINLVSVCTSPAMCGTAYCRQRRIECDASACVDRGDLPPVPRTDLSCAASRP